MLNVIFSYLVDDNVGEGMPRPEARDAVLNWLVGDAGAYNDTPPPDPDRWGLEPEHISGIERAFQMSGGLAPSV